MPNTIADNLSRLVTAKTDIANAITTMGGTVNTGDGFEEFPNDILGIPTQSTELLEPYNFSNGFQTTSERDISVVYRTILPDNSAVYVIDVARLNSSSYSNKYQFSIDNVDSSYNVIKYSFLTLQYSKASYPNNWVSSSSAQVYNVPPRLIFTSRDTVNGGADGYAWRISGILLITKQ